RKRLVCANQPKSPETHPIHAALCCTLCDLSLTQRRVRSLCAPPRLGSSLRAFTTASIRSVLGTSPAGAGAARRGAAASRAVSATAATACAGRKSRREGTSQILLDVPGLELRPSIEVQRKSRSDVKRLEEQHRERVGD